MGMSYQTEHTKVVSSSKARQIHLSHQVIDNFILGPDLEYIRYSNKPIKEICDQSGLDFNKLFINYEQSIKDVNSSPVLAAATTAWGRIIMNKVKFIHGNTFYYGDTDSGVLEKPLSSNLLGNEIGQFKLEYPKILKAFFISPKLYFLELENGKIISKGRGYSGKLTMLDYIELYNNKVVEVIDKRWRRNL
jgi:hypothetical protein